MKTIIDLEGIITKENKEEFTTFEYEQVVQGIHDHLKSKGCIFLMEVLTTLAQRHTND